MSNTLTTSLPFCQFDIYPLTPHNKNLTDTYFWSSSLADVMNLVRFLWDLI